MNGDAVGSGWAGTTIAPIWRPSPASKKQLTTTGSANNDVHQHSHATNTTTKHHTTATTTTTGGGGPTEDHQKAANGTQKNAGANTTNTSTSVSANVVPPPAADPIPARRSALESFLLKQSRLGDLHKHLATNVIRQLHGDVLSRAAAASSSSQGISGGRSRAITSSSVSKSSTRASSDDLSGLEKISVFKWVNERKQEMPTDFRIPRSADRDARWYWLLIKSFVTKTNCIEGYVPDATRLRSENYYKPLKVTGGPKPECPEPSLIDPNTGKIAARIKSVPRSVDTLLTTIRYSTTTAAGQITNDTYTFPRPSDGDCWGGPSNTPSSTKSAQQRNDKQRNRSLRDSIAATDGNGSGGIFSRPRTTSAALAFLERRRSKGGDVVRSAGGNRGSSTGNAATDYFRSRLAAAASTNDNLSMSVSNTITTNPQTDGMGNICDESSGPGSFNNNNNNNNSSNGNSINNNNVTRLSTSTTTAPQLNMSSAPRQSVLKSSSSDAPSLRPSTSIARTSVSVNMLPSSAHRLSEEKVDEEEEEDEEGPNSSSSSYEDVEEEVVEIVRGVPKVVRCLRRRRKKTVRAPDCADMLYSLQAYQRQLQDYYRTEWTPPIQKDKATLEAEAFFKKHNRKRAALLGYSYDSSPQWSGGVGGSNDRAVVDASTLARIGSPGKRTEKEMAIIRSELSRVSEFLNAETHMPVELREHLPGDEKRRRMALYGLRVSEGLYQPTGVPHYEQFEGKPRPRAAISVENAISTAPYGGGGGEGNTMSAAGEGPRGNSTFLTSINNQQSFGTKNDASNTNGLSTSEPSLTGVGNRIALRPLRAVEVGMKAGEFKGDQKGGGHGLVQGMSPIKQRHNEHSFSVGREENNGSNGSNQTSGSAPRASGKINYNQPSHYRTQPDFYYASDDDNDENTVGRDAKGRGQYTTMSSSAKLPAGERRRDDSVLLQCRGSQSGQQSGLTTHKHQSPSKKKRALRGHPQTMTYFADMVALLYQSQQATTSATHSSSTTMEPSDLVDSSSSTAAYSFSPTPSIEYPRLRVMDYSFMDLRSWYELLQKLPRSLPSVMQVKETPAPPVLTFLADPSSTVESETHSDGRKRLFSPPPTLQLSVLPGEEMKINSSGKIAAIQGKGDEAAFVTSAPSTGVGNGLGSRPSTAPLASSNLKVLSRPPSSPSAARVGGGMGVKGKSAAAVTATLGPLQGGGPPTRQVTVPPNYPPPTCYLNGLKAIEFAYLMRRMRVMGKESANQSLHPREELMNEVLRGASGEHILRALTNRNLLKNNGLFLKNSSATGSLGGSADGPTTAAHTEFGVFKTDYTTVEAKGEKYCFSEHQNPNLYAGYGIHTDNAAGGAAKNAKQQRLSLSLNDSLGSGGVVPEPTLRRLLLAGLLGGEESLLFPVASLTGSSSQHSHRRPASGAGGTGVGSATASPQLQDGGSATKSSSGTAAASSDASLGSSRRRSVFLYTTQLEEDLRSTKAAKKFLDHPIASQFFRLALGRFATPLLLEEEAVSFLEKRGVMRDVSAINRAEEREWAETIEKRLDQEEEQRLRKIWDARKAAEAEAMLEFKSNVRQQMRLSDGPAAGEGGGGLSSLPTGASALSGTLSSSSKQRRHQHDQRFDSPTQSASKRAELNSAKAKAGSPANFLRAGGKNGNRASDGEEVSDRYDPSAGAKNKGIKTLFNLFSRGGAGNNSLGGGGGAQSPEDSSSPRTAMNTAREAMSSHRSHGEMASKDGDKGGGDTSAMGKPPISSSGAALRSAPSTYQPVRINLNPAAGDRRTIFNGNMPSLGKGVVSPPGASHSPPASSNNKSSGVSGSANTAISHRALRDQQTALLLPQPFTEVSIVNLSNNRLGDSAAGSPFAEMNRLHQQASSASTDGDTAEAKIGEDAVASESGETKASGPNFSLGGRFVTPAEKALTAKTDSTISSIEGAIAALNKKTDRDGRAPKSITAALSAGIPTRTSRLDRERREKKKKLREVRGYHDDDDETESESETGGRGGPTGILKTLNDPNKRLKIPRKATDDEQLIESARLENDTGGMSFAGLFLLQRVSNLSAIAVIDLSVNLFEVFPVKLLHYELPSLVSLAFHGNKIASFAPIVELALGIVPSSHVPSTLLRERESETTKTSGPYMYSQQHNGASVIGGSIGKDNNTRSRPDYHQREGATRSASSISQPLSDMYVPLLERAGLPRCIEALMKTPDNCVYAFRSDPVSACFAYAGQSTTLHASHSDKGDSHLLALPLPHGTPYFKSELASPLQMRLRTLTLHGNPIETLMRGSGAVGASTGASIYRQKLLLLFPHLTSLDHNPVTVVERSLIL